MYTSNKLKSMYPAPKPVPTVEFETTYASEFCEKADGPVFRQSQTIQQRVAANAFKPKLANEEAEEEFDPYRTTSSAFNGGLPIATTSSNVMLRTNKLQPSEARERILYEFGQQRTNPRYEFAPSHAYGIAQLQQPQSVQGQTMSMTSVYNPYEYTQAPHGVRDSVWAETHAMNRLGVEREIGHDTTRRIHLSNRADPAAQRAKELEDERLARYRVYKRSYGVF